MFYARLILQKWSVTAHEAEVSCLRCKYKEALASEHYIGFYVRRASVALVLKLNATAFNTLCLSLFADIQQLQTHIADP